jgi:hypothetical protein
MGFRMCMTHFHSDQLSNEGLFGTIEQDIKPTNSHTQERCNQFIESALKYIDKGEIIDIQKAEASRAEDKLNIDQMILLAFEGSWHNANTFISRQISDMLTKEVSNYLDKDKDVQFLLKIAQRNILSNPVVFHSRKSKRSCSCNFCVRCFSCC